MRYILLFLSLLMPQISGQPVNVPVKPISEWSYGAGSRPIQLADGTIAALEGYHSSISVDVGVKPQFGTYTLIVPLANDFYSYPGPYEITISIGTKEFCSTYGWAIGQVSDIVLTCPVSNYFTLYNGYGFDASQHLFVSSHADGWPVYLKDVSLTFTPN